MAAAAAAKRPSGQAAGGWRLATGGWRLAAGGWRSQQQSGGDTQYLQDNVFGFVVVGVEIGRGQVLSQKEEETDHQEGDAQ